MNSAFVNAHAQTSWCRPASGGTGESPQQKEIELSTEITPEEDRSWVDHVIHSFQGDSYHGKDDANIGHSRTVALPQFVCDALAVTCEGKGRDDLLWPSQNARMVSAMTAPSCRLREQHGVTRGA